MRDRMRDPYFEGHLFRVRAVVAGLAALCLLSVLIGRLVYLQWVEHEHYAAESKNNRVRVRALEPTRGMILDRNGVVLAQNLPSYQLQMVHEEVEDVDATLAALREVMDISESEEERFRKLLRRSRRFEPVPIRGHLSESEVARFVVVRHLFPGVDVAATLVRNYPQGELMAHAVGYVGRINEKELRDSEFGSYANASYIGKTGIEHYYEQELRGETGFERVEANVAGRVVRTLERVPPQPGQDLVLSLDTQLQHAASEALGDESGSIVAIDPITGEVLALVSHPAFDANLFVNGISVADYKALNENPERPLFNRSVYGQYPPGSTIKPHLALASLRLQLTSASEGHVCKGYYQLPNVDHRYRDWKRWGHGKVQLDAAIEQSCDVVFYELAHRMGIDDLAGSMKDFGLGVPTGIDLPSERSGLVPTRDWKRRNKNDIWYPGETLIAGIGQGFMLATPLQLAMSVAQLASRGLTPVPRLHKGERIDGEMHYFSRTIPAQPVYDASPEQWRYIIDAMRDTAVVPLGTARKAFEGAAYSVAGKTGTAQVFSIEQDEEYNAEGLERKLRDHALFVGFAPIEAPRIAILTLVEHGGSGGGVAAPVARRVLDAYLNDIEPTNRLALAQ